MDVGRGFSPARFGEAEASPYVKKDFSLCPPPAGAQGVVLAKVLREKCFYVAVFNKVSDDYDRR
jgi:hypothetical protein